MSQKSEANKAAIFQLPNGNFIYPGRIKSVNAYRTGTPPNLWVALECVTTENETEVERIHCETYEQADALGRVFAAAMEKYFPQVSVSFVETTHAA